MNISLAKIIPLLLGSCALTAQAALITGQINIQSGLTGGLILTPNQLGAVTSVGASPSSVVTSAEGSYPTALVGDTVSFKGFTVGLGAQAISSLWSVTDTATGGLAGGFNYTFDLAAITAVFQSSTRLLIDGTGTLRSNNPGLDATTGVWSYGILSADGTATNGVFSFQSNNVSLGVAPNPVTGVPDSGSSIILLGVSLLGLFGLSRRLKSVV